MPVTVVNATDEAGNPAVLTPEEQSELNQLTQSVSFEQFSGAPAAPQEPPRVLSAMEPPQFHDELGSPIKLTPSESAEARKQANLIDPLLDLSPEEMADLARQSPETLEIQTAFQARPDVQQDPEAVRRIAKAWKLYRDQTGLSDISLKNIPGNLWGMAKGLYEYGTAGGPSMAPRGLPGEAKRVGELIKMIQTGDLTPDQLEAARGLTENVYATALSLEGMGRLAKSAVGKLSEEERKFKLPGLPAFGAVGGKSEEQRDLEKLFEDQELLKGTQELALGKRELLPGLGKVTEYLGSKGYPLRPEKIQEKAAGDPLTFYLFGKVFGAVSKAAPTVLSEEALRAAGAGVATGVGSTIEAGAKVAQKVVPPVAKAAPVAMGVKGALLGGSAGSPTAGAALGWTAGKAIKASMMKAVPRLADLEALGRQVAGKEAVQGPLAQLVKDVAESAPAAAYEVGKGAAADLAMTLPAETPEEMQGIGLGLGFGLFGGGMRMGGHVLSGQIIGPRAQGLKTPVPSRGIFPGLDTLSDQAYAGAPEGIQVRLNALRALLQSSFDNADIVYIPRPPKGAPDTAVPALMQLRDQRGNPLFTEEQARVWANARGLMSQDVGGKRLVFVRDVEAAPHEVSGHGIEAALGESTMRQIDSMIQSDPKYAQNWERLALDYVRSFPEMGRTTAPWQDFLLWVTKRGAAEAKEKLIRDQIGEGPYTKDQANALWSDWVSRSEGATPREQEINAVRSILTPEEFNDAANRAYAREVFAENAAASFEHGTAPDPTIAGRIAQKVGQLVRDLGGNPLAGRESTELGLPLSLDVIEQHRAAAQALAAGAKPTLEVPKPKGTPVRPAGGMPVTPEQQQDAAAEARAAAATAPETPPAEGGTRSARELLGQIAEAIAKRTGVKLNYLSAPDEPAAATTSKRTTRRAIIEAFRSMPEAARALWEKSFFPERVLTLKNGGYQVLGWSPEVFAANAHKTALAIADMIANDPAHAALSPYPIDPKTGSFTAEGWQQLYQDTQTFVQNQMAGRTGSGVPLVVPKEMAEAGAFAPKLEGGTQLDQARADFISSLYNFKLPETARVIRGKMPLNVIGAEVSEATLPGRTAEPVRPRATFEGASAEEMGIAGQPILEVNPFRQALEQAAKDTGVPLPSLIEAVQRLNLSNIKEVQHAPELPQFRGNTLALTAGFLPSREPGALRAAAVREKKTGKIFSGTFHGAAYMKAEEAGLKLQKSLYDEGFITNTPGEFLTRDEGTRRGVELQQIQPESVESAVKRGAGIEHVEMDTLKQPEWGTRPPEAAVQKLATEVVQSTPEQWRQLTQDRATSYPHEVGLAVKSPADLQLLKSTHDMLAGMVRAAMEAKDLPLAAEYGLKKQAVREAYETATGKTMDGQEDMTSTLRNFYGADYEPPAAQFLSRKGEVKFTQDDERNSFFTLGDSILEVEHSPDWKQVWGKTLYVPTAERMRGVGPALIEAAFDKVAPGGVYHPGEVVGSTAESQARYLKRLSDQTGVKLGEMHVNPEATFLPSKEPRAIKSAAVRDPETGEIYEGRMHFMARQAALKAGVQPMHTTRLQDGFVTNEGEFLTRNGALERALDFGQVDQTDQTLWTRGTKGLVSEELGSQFTPLNTTDKEIGFFPIGYKDTGAAPELRTEAAKAIQTAGSIRLRLHGEPSARNLFAFGPKGEDTGSAFSRKTGPKEATVYAVRGPAELTDVLRAELEAQIRADGLKVADAPEVQFAPNNDPRAVKEAAVRWMRSGKTYTGPYHGDAMDRIFGCHSTHPKKKARPSCPD